MNKLSYLFLPSILDDPLIIARFSNNTQPEIFKSRIILLVIQNMLRHSGQILIGQSVIPRLGTIRNRYTTRNPREASNKTKWYHILNEFATISVSKVHKHMYSRAHHSSEQVGIGKGTRQKNVKIVAVSSLRLKHPRGINPTKQTLSIDFFWRTPED